MPKQFLSLEPNEPPRLELEWGGYMRDFHIRLDGVQVGHISGGQRELIAGHEIILPDNSVLSIKLKNMGAVEQLQVLRDGRPLPGSASDPLNQYSAAVRIAFLWGISLLVISLLFILLNAPTSIAMFAFHPFAGVYGVGLILCSVGMARRIPLIGWLAILLFAIDTIAGINYMREMDAYMIFVTAGALFLRLFVLLRLLPSVRSFA